VEQHGVTRDEQGKDEKEELLQHPAKLVDHGKCPVFGMSHRRQLTAETAPSDGIYPTLSV
jgi:hypothetical protein